jgi:hypothetical protein
VDVENLVAAFLVWKRDLHVNFETTRTEKGIVDHVLPVGHTNDEDIIQRIHTIHLT